jgi:aspartyl protease family protein
MATKIKISFIVSFFFSYSYSFSQVTLASLIKAPLGNSYEQDVLLRKRTIKQTYYLTYCKEQNKYQLNFEEVPIDNYGNADITFTYLRNALVSIDLRILHNCSEYKSLVQIYKELDALVKQKYKGVVEILDGFEYELLEKNIYDSLKNVFENHENHKTILSNTLGWDEYKLNKNMFPDDRIVSINISSYSWSKDNTPHDDHWYEKKFNEINFTRKYDTICQQQISLSIYTKKSLKTIISYPSICKDLTTIERRSNTINLQIEGNVYSLKAKLNGILDNQEFIFDTGASDLTITPDVFLILYKAGTITESDFIGTATYQLADGSIIRSKKFILHELKIDDVVLNDIEVSISNNIQAPMLFGQSAITKLGNYKIDFKQSLLILEN